MGRGWSRPCSILYGVTCLPGEVLQVDMEELEGGEGRGAWRCLSQSFALLPLPWRQRVKPVVQEVLAAATACLCSSLTISMLRAAPPAQGASPRGRKTWRKTPTVHGDLQLRAANVMVRLPDSDAVPQISDVRFADFDWLPAVARLRGRSV